MGLPFDAREIRDAFDRTTFERGAAYAAGGVVAGLEVTAGGRRLRARVRGTQRTPYEVEVSVEDRRGRRIVSHCSCPVGVQCKHGVAVLLAALAEPVRAPAPVDPLAGAVGAWLEQVEAAFGDRPAAPAGPPAEQVLYVLQRRRYGHGEAAVLEPRVARRVRDGGWGADRGYDPATLAASSARFVRPADRLIGRIMASGYGFGGSHRLPDDPETVDLLLDQALATGRCHWAGKDGPALGRGPDRPGRLAWTLTAEGGQLPTVEPEEPGLVALPAASPWYVDPTTAHAGRLTSPLPRPALAALLAAPPILPAQAPLVRAALASRLGGLAGPEPAVVEEVRREPPQPCLTLLTHGGRSYSGWGMGVLDLAFLHFEYGGAVVEPDDPRTSLRRVEGNRVLVIQRQPKAEKAAARTLRELGLHRVGSFPGLGFPAARHAYMMRSGLDADWWRLLHADLPRLREAGWAVTVDPGFRHRVVAGDGDWQAMLGEAAGAWFALELGVEVEGERIPLLPVLTQALQQLRRQGGDPLTALVPGAVCYAPLPDGRVIALPADRLRPLLETLVELFDRDPLAGDGRLELSLSEALALAGLEETLRLRWIGAERLAHLAERLGRLGSLGEADRPPGLVTDLRPYQRRGLAWLGLIAETGLGGILADEMGLGKTVQTLAHVLAERAAGRLDRPVLVVCPTSLVANWRAEAARLAPDLRVLALHGPKRATAFAAIGEHDLVLSTYALLHRDAAALEGVAWHAVVLDEAQAIKNPASQAARAAARLRARHRLCLTGTPIENHLGELWSQASFLVPGLLGDHRRFGRVFRTPIEKQGDTARRELLARRLAPFVLRRTKAEVAAELPPRTEIVRRVELTGEQRDLYETVRLAMHERVRREIAANGFARSQIVILDALLKLRQVCCDPRLVKLATATRARHSAKLAHLLEMLDELVEEGRRVLLFSQFTSMLDLIRPELERHAIRFVELTGETADRARPVASFQAGKAPVFLLSLKAGGVGLNLTAADTVILYDPWWNPAVEAQAADRAHRIGQDKAVFVYKLIAEGTIEERMLELQARKRALAEGVLDVAGGEHAAFAEADLEALLRPLP